MRNKNSEKMIKNLQKIIERRREREDSETIKILKEELEREDDGTEIPLSVSFSLCGSMTNGLMGGIVGFATGKIIEELANRSEIFSNIATGILDIIHNANNDTKS